jgi:AcrR family transcriptional regulator
MDRGNRAEERRRHLLATARGLFIRHGFHNTGIAQIAAESGIKVGQIYRDFASKEDIIAAIVEADVAVFLDEASLAEALAAGDTKAICAWIKRLVSIEGTIDECRMMSEIVAESARSPRVAEINRAIDHQVRAGLSVALEAIAPGPDAALDRCRLADFILITGVGLMMRRVVDPRLDAEATATHIGTIIDREIARLRS